MKQKSLEFFLESAPKRQLGWLNLPRSPRIPLPVTAKHRVVKFQEISMNNG